MLYAGQVKSLIMCIYVHVSIVNNVCIGQAALTSGPAELAVMGLTYDDTSWLTRKSEVT